MSIDPFNRLVKLAARAFYDDFTTKGENQPKIGRSDNRGIAVIVLDALTRRQWVREEDLAKDLKVHSKQLRRALRFFEEEKLVMRDYRKETAKGVKMHNAAVAAVTDGQHGRNGEDKVKLHIHSYCCLDYAQIYDVVRYRLHRMRKKLKEELESRNTIQEYICHNCGKRYNALDAARLVSMEDEYFHCESCNGELVVESDKIAMQDMGDGDDNARRRRREKLKDMLQKMEAQLKPLIEQLNRVKDLQVPEYGNLQAWEARFSNRAGHGDPSGSDSRSQGLGGTPMPFLGPTLVDVNVASVKKDEDDNSDPAKEPMKVLPPWMIREGMNLTKEQRGEVKLESKMDAGSASAGLSDDKKTNEDTKAYQDEYLKAYYAALYEAQQKQGAQEQPDLPTEDGLEGDMKPKLEDADEGDVEWEEATPSDVFYGKSSDRQVGMKSRREDDDDDDVQWEEDIPAANQEGSYKVDLNVEADAAADNDDDEDDVEWEEG